MCYVSWLRAWWWSLVFCGCVGLAYWHGMKVRNLAFLEISEKVLSMEEEIAVATAEKEILAQRIASQSDPAWIELVLLKQMGVVPEGFLKVHFKK